MQYSDNTATKIAEYLLQIHAIKLQPQQPFTWASGWKSPIYSDNRLILSYPEIRNFVKKELALLVKKSFPNAKAVIGVATAGIAPGALVADELQLPFGYVRPEPKKHGMGKQIEGDIKQGTEVVVIEDLVSTGKSSLQAIDVLRNNNCNVLGLACIFTYLFDLAQQNFEKSGMEYAALCNYNVLVQTALQKNYIQPNDVELLTNWRIDPENWGK
ncbi:MAG: orotate phosphoribosyltransferase [Bacteroidia bacterium]